MNPFRETIVSDPWRVSPTDVPEIQARVFSDCLLGVEHVRQVKRSAALLIHGGAGSGKTHLLSRLRKHLTLQAPTATDRDECLFVWIRLQASPRMIWRHVRRTLVEDWFRPVRDQSTQFARILFHRFAEIRIAEGDLEPWYEYMLETHPSGLDELLERVADSLYLDRNTTIAFKHLAFHRHTRDLRAWLAGDSLPEEALARLDLSQEDGTDEDREHEARRVVLMLCRLAGDNLPIVISLDQVEALQTSPTDRDGLFAFGQVVSTLHDETSNVFVVSCIQSAFATELKDKSRGADYDRMTSLGTRSLATLTRSEAEKLIAARRSLPDVELPQSSLDDPLWPLQPEDFHRLAAVDELTPRRLLSTCADRFDAWMRRSESGSVEPSEGVERDSATSLDAFLQEEWQNRLKSSSENSLPGRSEEILRHGLPLLMGLLGIESKQIDDQLPDVHLVAVGHSGDVGISICTQSNMNSAANQLKRLNAQLLLKRVSNLVVLRDPRTPLSKGAKVARQSLEELEKAGAVSIYPSEQILACLDALRNLLSDAKSGELANQGVSVVPSQVSAWLSRQLTAGTRSFLQQIIEPNRKLDRLVE